MAIRALAELHFTSESRALYVEFANAIEQKLVPSGSLTMVKAFASKLPEQAARIAGILALIADPATSTIDVMNLRHGIKLAQYYLAEASRLIAAGTIDPHLQRAEALRQWLCSRADDLIALSEVYQLGPSSLRQADKARSAMQILVDHGWALPMPDGAVVDGKMCREAWRIIRC